MTIITQQTATPAFVFTDSLEDRELFRIQRDGKIIKNENVSWDDCAKMFWEAVERTRQGAVVGDRDTFIRAAERDRIVKALEADHSKDTTQPHPHGPCYINMDRVIAIVRGEV
jgi:hypothetical protein